MTDLTKNEMLQIDAAAHALFKGLTIEEALRQIDPAIELPPPLTCQEIRAPGEYELGKAMKEGRDLDYDPFGGRPESPAERALRGDLSEGRNVAEGVPSGVLHRLRIPADCWATLRLRAEEGAAYQKGGPYGEGAWRCRFTAIRILPGDHAPLAGRDSSMPRKIVDFAEHRKSRHSRSSESA
jgi:hypothetical protein